MRRLDSALDGFETEFTTLLQLAAAGDQALSGQVAGIIADVRARGDAALLEYTRKLDGLDLAEPGDLEVAPQRMAAALAALAVDERAALELAAERIRTYAERQKLTPWQFQDAHGNTLGQLVRPLDRVGIYAPGGQAAYPSSVLMNALPAQVAGVGEIVLVSPAAKGRIPPMVLAAAAVAGVGRMFTIGGAQAVAALAYGTATVPAVDKIVGPGNAWVAAAKRQVFGQVGIDMIAGPSEVLIIGDGSVSPDWIALDLFAQAEHDADARSLLLSPDAAWLDAVAAAIVRLLPRQPRADIIRAALQGQGALIRVTDLDQAVTLANRIAPEHLELAVAEPRRLVDRIRHAGAVFLGAYSAEVLGDYCAGPNHVLPTAATARFSSPLGVYDFQKRISLIEASRSGAAVLAPVAARLARAEGLEAHAQSADARAG